MHTYLELLLKRNKEEVFKQSFGNELYLITEVSITEDTLI
jgi:hypothetical protein